MKKKGGRKAQKRDWLRGAEVSSPAFDWYAGTLYDLPPKLDVFPREIYEFVALEFNAQFGIEGIWIDREKGQNGYLRSFEFKAIDMDTGELDQTVCTFLFNSHNASPSLRASGNTAGMLAQIMRMDSFPYSHHVTRADIAFDTVDASFDELHDYLKDYALRKRLKTTYYGDYDRKEKGRTYYIGSRDSEVYLRIYEKGLEQRQKGWVDAPKDWVRIEFEIKPRKEVRQEASAFDHFDFVRLSRWALEFMELFGFEGEHIAKRVEERRTTLMKLRAFALMRSADWYAEILREECGGSFEALGRLIGEAVKEREEMKKALDRQSKEEEEGAGG